MIATDLASRGLDIVDIDLVIHYDMASNKETYTHRIGRTSRQDKVGKAITLYNQHQKNTISYLSSNLKECALPTPNRQQIKTDRYTLLIKGGKKDKLRKGDIVGTLCKEVGIESSSILQIDIEPTLTYIALSKDTLPLLKNLSYIKIKKRKYPLYIIQ
jgi:ATP-independent RNA helicase DbpA